MNRDHLITSHSVGSVRNASSMHPATKAGSARESSGKSVSAIWSLFGKLRTLSLPNGAPPTSSRRVLGHAESEQGAENANSVFIETHVSRGF